VELFAVRNNFCWALNSRKALAIFGKLPAYGPPGYAQKSCRVRSEGYPILYTDLTFMFGSFALRSLMHNL
jgi:hypothetical protein